MKCLHNYFLKTLPLVLLFLFSGVSYSQTSTNRSNLQLLTDKYSVAWQNRNNQVQKYASEKGLPVRSVMPDGKIMEMVAVVDGKPVYYTTENLGAAATTRASELWTGGSLGLNLDGTGYTGLGEWDGGAVRAAHNEFTSGGTQSSRIIQVDGATSVSDHATHVAGTLVAQGYSGNAKGMNYKGTLKAYDWNSDDAEMAAAAANGLELSNHSYGFIHGWYWNGSSWDWYGNAAVSTQEDYHFGLYTTDARNWDDIAYNAPFYLIVKSAGNDRGDGPTDGAYPQDGAPNGYDCIGTQAVAKNILTVGAVNEVTNYTGPASVVMSSFSSWGPADDGRIKPDIVGKGVGLYSSIGSSNSAYASYSGTSMSSPNVAGTLALLQQHYRNLNGGQSMRAATLKALVINTADECGSYPGPDYQYGWGLLNAEKAAQLISNDAVTNNVISELSLSNGSTYVADFYSDGTQPLVVAITWTDPAGTALSNVIDPVTSALVNDLDLLVTGSGNNFYPYKLDRNNPSAAATNNSENNIDNVELVNIANPVPGVYTIRVDHDGSLTASQAFSLVVRGAAATPPVNNDAGISAITEPTGSICASTINPQVVLTNYGLNVLNTVTLYYQVDSNPVQSYLWTGTLAGAASQTVTLPAVAVENGSHTFTVFTANPNNVPDNKPENDLYSSIFNKGNGLTLKLVFDNYPEETSWNITDGNNKIVASGGSYGSQPDGSTLIQEICAPNECLNFTIFDSYGDGMCCSYGNGSYELKDNQTGVILATGGQYNASETTPFCPPQTGLMVTITNKGDVSCGQSADGFANAQASGGTGNYSYSWSNGQTGPNAINLAAGTYTVTVNDGQATSNANVVITDPNNTYYFDGDDDGFGIPETTIRACTLPSGYAGNSTDCNDNDPLINPDATEICDGKDNNCDGETDEGCGGCTYEVVNFNNFETGLGIWADGGTDCQRIAKFPKSGSYSIELRDNTTTSVLTTTNQNLSGYDELKISFSYYPVSMDNAAEDFWLQISNDGGVTFTTVEEWNLNDEFVNNTRYEEAVTVSGPFTATTKIRFRCDASGDADMVYIDDVKIEGCISGAVNNPPVAQFSVNISCLTASFTDISIDSDGTIQSWLWDFGDGGSSTLQNPVHSYNGAGNYLVTLTVHDNLGETDETSQNITISATTTYYQDSDNDGFGNPAVSQTTCSPPAGYVLNNTDCDDTRSNVYPGAPEICDGLDNDCDGQTDENALTYYRDADGDSFGNPNDSQLACSPPAGYVLNNTDCDDSRAAVYPGAPEICDGLDNDCDGQTDENALTYYRDADGDSFGNPNDSQLACSPPAGYVLNNTDCDDSHADVYPGAPEICGDALDNNCNGTIDEGCAGCVFETINSNNFETGFGIWLDGGTDCRRINMYPSSGSYSIELRDNTTTSVITTSNLNLTAYNELKVKFSFFAASMDNAGEDFWLQISKNGGTTYTLVEEWNKGDEFENFSRKNDEITIPGPFTTTTRLRFRCDGGDDSDWIYIDDVEISGCRNTGNSEVVLKSGDDEIISKNLSTDADNIDLINKDFAIKVYPNPFNNEIHIQIEDGKNYSKSTVIITDITGKKVFNKVYGKERGIVIYNPHLAPGSYFIQVVIDEYVKTEHLIRTE